MNQINSKKHANDCSVPIFWVSESKKVKQSYLSELEHSCYWRNPRSMLYCSASFLYDIMIFHFQLRFLHGGQIGVFGSALNPQGAQKRAKKILLGPHKGNFPFCNPRGRKITETTHFGPSTGKNESTPPTCWSFHALELFRLIHKQPGHDPFFAENQFSLTDEFVFMGLVVRSCHFDVPAGALLLIFWKPYCDLFCYIPVGQSSTLQDRVFQKIKVTK